MVPWHYGSPMVPNILEDEYMLMVETFTNFDKITYSELLKLNDFNEMSVPAARTQLLKLTNVASSLCLAS